MGRDNGSVDVRDLNPLKKPKGPAPSPSGPAIRLPGAGAVRAIAFSPDGKWIAGVRDKDPRIALQRFENDRGPIGEVMLLEGHEGQVSQVAFARGNNETTSYLVSA